MRENTLFTHHWNRRSQTLTPVCEYPVSVQSLTKQASHALQHGLTYCQPRGASVCLPSPRGQKICSGITADLPVLSLLSTSAGLVSRRTDPGGDKQAQDGDETEKLPKDICERLRVGLQKRKAPVSPCSYWAENISTFLWLDLPTEQIKSWSKGLCNIQSRMSLVMVSNPMRHKFYMRALNTLWPQWQLFSLSKRQDFWLPGKPFFGPICVTRLLCSEKDMDHLEKTQTTKKNWSSRKHLL